MLLLDVLQQQGLRVQEGNPALRERFLPEAFLPGFLPQIRLGVEQHEAQLRAAAPRPLEELVEDPGVDLLLLRDSAQLPRELGVGSRPSPADVRQEVASNVRSALVQVVRGVGIDRSPVERQLAGLDPEERLLIGPRREDRSIQILGEDAREDVGVRERVPRLLVHEVDLVEPESADPEVDELRLVEQPRREHRDVVVRVRSALHEGIAVERDPPLARGLPHVAQAGLVETPRVVRRDRGLRPSEDRMHDLPPRVPLAAEPVVQAPVVVVVGRARVQVG